jgi:phosphomannomutase
MFSLTSIDNKLVLTQKRCGLVVEKSFIAGIHVNDEVIEINHIKVQLLNNVDVKRYLSESNITLLILPSDKEQLIKICLEANNIYAEKSFQNRTVKIIKSCDNLLQVMNTYIYLHIILCFMYFFFIITGQ